MRIEDILAAKGSEVVTIAPTTTVAQAVADLARYSIGALVVSGGDDRIDGIVSERDVVRRLAGDLQGLLGRPVADIMSAPVRTCRPDDDVESAMAVMTDHRVRHLPVARDGRLCGLVSIGDVVKNRIEALQQDRQLLVDYISAR